MSQKVILQSYIKKEKAALSVFDFKAMSVIKPKRPWLMPIKGISKFTQKQLAAKLGISYQAYQRMERPGRSNVTVHTLERIAEALGSELILDMRPKRKVG